MRVGLKRPADKGSVVWAGGRADRQRLATATAGTLSGYLTTRELGDGDKEQCNEWGQRASLCSERWRAEQIATRCVVVGVEGIEPSTDRLKGDCSTAELHPECAVLAGTGGIEPPTCHLEGDRSTPTELRPEAGAEGRVRTGDTTLFRRVLYQLSYPGASTIG